MQCASSLILKFVAALAAFLCLTGCAPSTTSHEASRVDGLTASHDNPEPTPSKSTEHEGSISAAAAQASSSRVRSSDPSNLTLPTSDESTIALARAEGPLPRSSDGNRSNQSKGSDASPTLNPSSSTNQDPVRDGSLGGQSTSSASSFEPPFPNRMDLFAVPKRTHAGPQGFQGDEEAVELIGFVRRDTPRAILSIDGQIAPMAQGDAQYGVQVISIQPPIVVLQRGRERWQASLEN